MDRVWNAIQILQKAVAGIFNPPSTPAPPTDTPTEPTCDDDCTPTPSQHFANGRYDRQAAVEFALRYKDKSVFEADGYPTEPNDCTNFISYALQAGGLLQTADWYPRSPVWVGTSRLFDFLPSVGFTPGERFQNTDDFRDNNDPDKQDNYLQLRENTQDMIRQNGMVRMKWADFMNAIRRIQPGDLVFYHDNRFESWSHVAMVTTAWAEPTHVLGIATEIQEPLIVDHDGPVEPENLPRSMGDTNNEYIMEVQILYAP